jgi:hypothetical protein
MAFSGLIFMLNRKNMASHGSQRNSGRGSGGSKKIPTRRRFIISSKARRDEAKSADSNGKASLATGQNGHAAATAPVGQPTVELNETIKTLLHLAQEHGYVTYDDINDVLPDNLNPDDLDALMSKLRSLDVEIVMDHAEAERAKQPEPAHA